MIISNSLKHQIFNFSEKDISQNSIDPKTKANLLNNEIIFYCLYGFRLSSKRSDKDNDPYWKDNNNDDDYWRNDPYWGDKNQE